MYGVTDYSLVKGHSAVTLHISVWPVRATDCCSVSQQQHIINRLKIDITDLSRETSVYSVHPPGSQMCFMPL